ncbi:hypothetical protein [Ancylobacter defluvii]|uniref:Uncharacterized protein n=1 Tax=Ancylobacter defluvii TaxID=1282440 RepID=A0A9W6K1H0_9HYPH|nr:hypothetical protein [Ancylobacter defluvii]MBS7586477.1 hypothetical protein [Ancylobacter defluvii]GLK85759.1 hypothetical protein GCM10017653_38290 [Ancylobacter defluvii]
MSSPFTRLDADTAEMLDRCMTKMQKVAATLESKGDGPDICARLALALIEATGHGERDEEHLMDFALRALPAYRERHVAR